jgi:uncharacterized protein (TIGR00288 family)
MKSQRLSDGERILAVFIDFENLALGFGARRDRFSIEKVLERLVEKGKAYADWSRFGYYTTALHEAAVELIEIPKRVITGKNSADIRMCVDAMDLAYSKDHIDTFVIVSGDSDFSPLVSKLKELGRDVIGLGLADSTSNLLRDNCDEFIYYEDLDRVGAVAIKEAEGIPEQKRKMFALLLDSLLALRRENKELIFSSMVKDTMKRKRPSFNEEYFGYRNFSDLLEDAQAVGILDLDRHKNSGGTYVVTRFGSEPRQPGDARPVLPPPPVVNGGNRAPRQLPAGEPIRKPMLPPAREPQGHQPPVAPPPQAREPSREPARREQPPPPRPAPIPAPTRGRGPARPPADRPASDDRAPLGRALIEEADVFDDDDDQIPTYMPRKTTPKPAPVERPAPVAETPANAPPRRRAASPAKAGTPPVRDLEAPREVPKVAARPTPAEKPAAPKPERRATPPRAPKPAAPPADDGFGAGLDD